MAYQLGTWYQAMLGGKLVWHFLPTAMPCTYPAESEPKPEVQWKLTYPAVAQEQKATVWKSAKEAPPPSKENAIVAYGNTIVLHTSEITTAQSQALVSADVGYHKNCTHNVYNTYNYRVIDEATATAAAEAASKTKGEAKSKKEAQAKGEGIYITEDEFKMDEILQEQVQALHQLHYLHTVDYGAGDVYGRRYTRQ